MGRFVKTRWVFCKGKIYPMLLLATFCKSCFAFLIAQDHAECVCAL